MAMINDNLGDVRYCVEVLKIEVNGTDDNPASQRRPLHWAVIKNRDVIAHYLLNQGAKPNFRMRMAKRPLITLLQQVVRNCELFFH